MFEGKTALVVGATSGMGEATAIAFSRQGANVLIAGRRAAEGEAIAAGIKDEGGEASFLPVDVADEQSIVALIAAGVARYGRIDCAVNNAAKEIPSGMLAERSAEDCDAIMAVNVRGVFLCMKYQIKQMLLQGGGAIVNIASSSGHVGFPGAALYTASKHAVVGMTRAAGLEYVKLGIRINAISPGVVDTQMMRRYLATVDYTLDALASAQPIGRPADPFEIAAATLWLCSPAASYVVGQAIPVDGGITAQ